MAIRSGWPGIAAIASRAAASAARADSLSATPHTASASAASAISAKVVVVEVMIVRDKTALIDRSIICGIGSFLYFFIISRIRSSTTTVSLSDRPTMVRMAAIEVMLNSSRVTAKKPTVSKRSCMVAITAATASCHS